MISESARMSSTAEARFRVQAPNSTPRATAVIALDAAGEAVAGRLARSHWARATFLTAAGPDLDGQIAAADLVVLLAGPGGHAQAAPAVGQACRRHQVMTTGFIVGAGAASESALSKTLAQVRPWSLMVVIANDDGYIDDMLRALRA